MIAAGRQAKALGDHMSTTTISITPQHRGHRTSERGSGAARLRDACQATTASRRAAALRRSCADSIRFDSTWPGSIAHG
jgi:hypothetical protein